MTIRAIRQPIQVNPAPQRTGQATRGSDNDLRSQTPPLSAQVSDSQQGRKLADALYRQTIYDQPRDSRTSTAIATYKEYAFLERREEVKAMLHVSVYA